MKDKIASLLSQLEVLEHKLSHPQAFEDAKAYKALTQEHSYLNEIKSVWQEYEAALHLLEQNTTLLKSEKDPEMVALIQEDVALLKERVSSLEGKLENLLVPPDPEDHRNVIVEIRAGTGGDEAALFVGDCVRMYHLYAARRGWKYELLSCSPSEIGGFKEYIMVVSGPNVKRFMQYEGGTHRVQRVPDTEASGRIHTSAITVAVLLEPTGEEDIDLDEKDLRVDTYRSSGAGGQHVNTTDSAVRITHIPTGIVAYCQEERSQHKNKDKALRLLKAKIINTRREEREKKEAAARSSQVGSGDRSERIRTYNFPQNRVTDHRINLTLYNLDRVMAGELEAISDGLVSYFHQEKLAT